MDFVRRSAAEKLLAKGEKRFAKRMRRELAREVWRAVKAGAFNAERFDAIVERVGAEETERFERELAELPGLAVVKGGRE